MSKPGRCAAAFLFASFATASVAADPDSPVAPEEDAPAPSPFARCDEDRPDDDVLDLTRAGIHQTVCGATLWFDGLFGERDLRAAREGYGQIDLTTGYSEFDGSETKVRFNAKVQLPALERRLSVFVGRGEQEDFERDRVEGEGVRSQVGRPDERDSFVAGLGLTNIRTDRFMSEFRIGAQNVRLPKFFVQNRFGYRPLEDDRNRIYLRATPFWNNRDRSGVTAGAEFDRVLADRLLLRWSNTGTLSQRSAGVDWRSAIVLYQRLRNRNALAYEIFIRGLSQAPENIPEYGLRLIYRHGLFRRRLFVELSPGYSWPRVDPTVPREGSAGITLSVQLPFGESRQRDRE